MNATQIINGISDLIKTNLSKQKLAEVKTKDGATLIVEEMAIEGAVFIKDPEGEEQVPVPDGDYELESGEKIEVKEGKITEIESAESEESEEELNKNKSNMEEKEKKEEMAYATKEELAEVKTGLQEIKEMIEAMNPKKEEMSQEEPKQEEPKQELSKQESKEEKKEEVEKTELSQEPQRKATGAPVEEERTTLRINQPATRMSAIMSNIAKIK